MSVFTQALAAATHRAPAPSRWLYVPYDQLSADIGPLSRATPAPEPPDFAPDDITREVCALVSETFADHPGELRPDALPASAADADALWIWAQRFCLADFGRFEDAMSTRSSGLFHTRIAPLLNLHRLLPRTVVADACRLDIPLSSKEGFVRQLLGWREFVRHVHRATDGFRCLPPATSPGIQSTRALPPAYWGTASGLACLDRVVADVWRDAYSHHITRLMVLCNLAALLDIDAREVSDWFWIAYADAYDWVVEPNVLGMGMFAAGDVMTTKPYVSGAPYLDRMSDYCKSCAFNPKKNCPVTRLYWAYFARNEQTLESVQRLRVPLVALRKRAEALRREDMEIFERVSAALEHGERLTPSR